MAPNDDSPGIAGKIMTCIWLGVLVWAIVKFAQTASQYAQAHGFVGR